MPAEPKAGSCGVNLSFDLMVWLAVSSPTTSLTSAYFNGTTSNTAPGPSFRAAMLGGLVTGPALTVPLVLVVQSARDDSGEVTSGTGVPPGEVGNVWA